MSDKRVAAEMRAGDIVYFKSGIWAGNLDSRKLNVVSTDMCNSTCLVVYFTGLAFRAVFKINLL